MMTTKNGMIISQNTQNIIKQKAYNYPNEIWDIIKEYMGIGYYWKQILILLQKLNTQELKNIIDCTFRCVLPIPSEILYNNELINTFRRELLSYEYSVKLRHLIVKRTKQTIKELGKNLSSEMLVSTYATQNISCLFLGIENNMYDKFPHYPKIKATPRRFDQDVQFAFR
jgi:hypothetical protein